LEVAIDAEDDAIVCEADDARPWAAAITLQVVAIAFGEVGFFLGGVAHRLDVVAIQSEEGAIRSHAAAIRSRARAIQVETGPFGPKPLACRLFVLAIRAHGHAFEPEGDAINCEETALALSSPMDGAAQSGERRAACQGAGSLTVSAMPAAPPQERLRFGP
jgi:hypothetical protein